MMHVTVFEALVNRGRYLGLWVADGYAAAGLHTSASAWAAADRQENKRMQGMCGIYSRSRHLSDQQ